MLHDPQLLDVVFPSLFTSSLNQIEMVPLVCLLSRHSLTSIQTNVSGKVNTDTAALKRNTVIAQVQKSHQ